jgi:tetratricopeptide (TPR) repeat protein
MPPRIRPVCGCIFALFALLTGCSQLTVEQRQWLSDAKSAYEAKQYARSIEHAARFLEQVLDAPETAEALYYKGLSEAYSDRRREAYKDLQHAVTLDGPKELRWRAHAALGSLHFEDSEWEKAAEEFGIAAAIMPEAAPRDLILYRQGLARERSGDWPAAQAVYEQLIAEYHGSNSALAAERRLGARSDTFAVRVGEFAVPENADNFMFELQRQGLTPYLYRDRRGPKTVYVVLIGRYETQEEAERATEQLREFVPHASIWP